MEYMNDIFSLVDKQKGNTSLLYLGLIQPNGIVNLCMPATLKSPWRLLSFIVYFNLSRNQYVLFESSNIVNTPLTINDLQSFNKLTIEQVEFLANFV